MTEAWSLPGFDVQELLGFGATGEVWRARELATGDTVALKRVRRDADPAAVEALRREALLLRTLDTPYVVRLREVVGAGADAVLVLDHADGGSLAALLARRSVLDAGEVVTVAVPLAQALAAAHARGIVHGDVTPANVLFTAEGMPLLADLGVARLVGERLAQVDGTAEYVDPAVARGGEPDAAADVWSLAAVCHRLLAGTPPHDGTSAEDVLGAASAGERAPLGLLAPDAPRPLVEAVEAALVDDPSRRPDAAGFAALLRRAHAAAPVRLSGPVVAPVAARETHAVRVVPDEPPERVRRRLPQGVLLAGVLVVLVALAATVGWVSGRGGEGAGSSLARVPVSWSAVLRELDAARGEAFAVGDPLLLRQVYADASPGLAADTALLASLRAQDRTAHGLRHEVRTVQVLDESPEQVRLRVVDVLAGYELRDSSGSVVARGARRGERAFSVELRRVPEGWRLVEVSPTG